MGTCSSSASPGLLRYAAVYDLPPDAYRDFVQWQQGKQPGGGESLYLPLVFHRIAGAADQRYLTPMEFVSLTKTLCEASPKGLMALAFQAFGGPARNGTQYASLQQIRQLRKITGEARSPSGSRDSNELLLDELIREMKVNEEINSPEECFTLPQFLAVHKRTPQATYALFHCQEVFQNSVMGKDFWREREAQHRLHAKQRKKDRQVHMAPPPGEAEAMNHESQSRGSVASVSAGAPRESLHSVASRSEFGPLPGTLSATSLLTPTHTATTRPISSQGASGRPQTPEDYKASPARREARARHSHSAAAMEARALGTLQTSGRLGLEDGGSTRFKLTVPGERLPVLSQSLPSGIQIWHPVVAPFLAASLSRASMALGEAEEEATPSGSRKSRKNRHSRRELPLPPSLSIIHSGSPVPLAEARSLSKSPVAGGDDHDETARPSRSSTGSIHIGTSASHIVSRPGSKLRVKPSVTDAMKRVDSRVALSQWRSDASAFFD